MAAMTTTSASIGDAYAHDRTKIAKTAARLGGMQMGVGMLLGPALGATIFLQIRAPWHGFGGHRWWRAGVSRPAATGARGAPRVDPYEDGGQEPLRRAATTLFSEGAPLAVPRLRVFMPSVVSGESAVYSPFMVDIWGAGPKGLALTMTVVGPTFAASQALLVGPLVKKFGAAGALRSGYACSTLQRVIWSYYTYPGIMLVGLAMGSPGFGADSIIQQLALDHPSSTPPLGELAALLGH